jgi:hypothetical protein
MKKSFTANPIQVRHFCSDTLVLMGDLIRKGISEIPTAQVSPGIRASAQFTHGIHPSVLSGVVALTVWLTARQMSGISGLWYC